MQTHDLINTKAQRHQDTKDFFKIFPLGALVSFWLGVEGTYSEPEL
jgi:hypothetical protein